MDQESQLRGMERRALLKRAGLVAGTTVWVAPTVQSLVSPAFATGTGMCQPEDLIRFKFNINQDDQLTVGSFDSGDAVGDDCKPEGYDDDTTESITDPGEGINTALTTGGCTITITTNADDTVATVTFSPGVIVHEVTGKGGGRGGKKCGTVVPLGGNSYQVTITSEDDGTPGQVSHVSGTFCCPG